MTENNAPNAVALAWVEALAQRGVRLEVRGKTLAMMPKSAYGEMSADERRTLKLHKQEILDLVRGGRYAPATLESKAAPAPAREPVCPFCMRPCVGREHPAFATLHALDEQEQWRRAAEQRDADVRERMLRARYGLPSPRWD